MNKKDLALNNLQWLICHKIKSNQTKSNLNHNQDVKQGQFLSGVPLV